RRLINETIRRIINALIVDLIGTTRAGIAEVAPQCIDDVRAAPALVAFSAAMHEEARVLKRFLFDNLYRHYLVMRMSA
ncbi:deoxyguanosinetriphosphate triphosphohydrolase, partial [Pandoraea pneumonica]